MQVHSFHECVLIRGNVFSHGSCTSTIINQAEVNITLQVELTYPTERLIDRIKFSRNTFLEGLTELIDLIWKIVCHHSILQPQSSTGWNLEHEGWSLAALVRLMVTHSFKVSLSISVGLKYDSVVFLVLISSLHCIADGNAALGCLHAIDLNQTLREAIMDLSRCWRMILVNPIFDAHIHKSKPHWMSFSKCTHMHTTFEPWIVHVTTPIWCR